MALSSLYGALFPLRPCILSMTLFFLNSPLSYLPPSVSSTALCPLYRPLSPQRPSVLSTALCPIYHPLSPLQPSVPSMALCSLYGPLKTAKKAKLLLLFRKMFWKTHFVKTPGCRDLFRISDDRNRRDHYDYHSSEILSDNREIAIIASAKKVAIIAIITSNKKR